MNRVLEGLIDSLELGEPQSFDGLTVVPIMGPAESALPYVSLSQALESGSLIVDEVSATGSVPELVVHNHGGTPVLLCDGEELVGAKQNRLVNVSMLLPARSKRVLDVTCSEAGRWHRVTPAMGDSGILAAYSVRRVKNLTVADGLASTGMRRSDQGAVWADIHRLHARMGTMSATGAMRDAYAARQAEVDRYVHALPSLNGQTGLIAILDGVVIGCDYVSRPEVYARLHPKLVRSYGLEAVARRGGMERSTEILLSSDARAPDQSPTQSHTLGQPIELVRDFIAAIRRASETERDSPGMGVDVRKRSPEVLASALIFGDEVVHLAAFATEAVV